MILWLVLLSILGLIGTIAWYLDHNQADLSVAPPDAWQTARAAYEQRKMILSWSSQVFQRTTPLVRENPDVLPIVTMHGVAAQQVSQLDSWLGQYTLVNPLEMQ